MKTRRLLVGLLVGLVATFLASAALAAAGFNIAVNNTMKPGGAEEVAIKKFKEVVEKESQGRIKVNMFMSGQLGDEPSVLELMKIGQTEMSLTGGQFRGMYAKQYDPVTIPFYMPTWQCVKAYFDGPLGQKIKDLTAQKGGIYDFGPQMRTPRITTSNKKIMTPEDLKGVKFRVPEIPVWVDVWKELGTMPVIIPAPDIFLAMKTGTVDAHENTMVSPYSRRMWEVQKYIILTNHVWFPWHWTASKIWYDKRDPKDKELIQKAVKEAVAAGEKSETEMDEFYVKELKKNGMEFISPDLKSFRDKAMPAIKRSVAALAPEVAAEVEKLCAK